MTDLAKTAPPIHGFRRPKRSGPAPDYPPLRQFCLPVPLILLCCKSESDAVGGSLPPSLPLSLLCGFYLRREPVVINPNDEFIRFEYELFFMQLDLFFWL